MIRIVVWLVRAFIFTALFAFALNNQHPVTVHGFLGLEWQTPLVIVLLLAFAIGAALGVLAMVPSWWRARRATAATPAAAQDSQAPPLSGPLSGPPSGPFFGPPTRPPTAPLSARLGAQATARDSMAEYPPRFGL